MRKSIQPDKIESIALNFPDLNTGWLLTGEGQMLKNTETCDVTHAQDFQHKYFELLERHSEVQSLLIDTQRKYAALQDKYMMLIEGFQKKDAPHQAGVARVV